MTKELMGEVLLKHLNKIEQCVNLTHYQIQLNDSRENAEKLYKYEHLLEMIPKAILFLKEGRVEKACRWLGFIQGVLWTLDDHTLTELKAFNRSKT